MPLTKPFGFQTVAAGGGGEIVTTDLQHWWSVLDTASYPGTGATWTDLQGNQNLDLNGITFTTIGGVDTLYDSGGGGSASKAVSTATIAADYTVEAWVFVNSSQGTGNNYPLIFEYGAGGGTQGAFSNFRKDRNTLASYNFGSPPWVYDSTDTNDFSRNTWQHMVWAQSSTSMTHYVNASQTYSQSKTYSARTCNGNYRMWSDADRYFEGGIAVCRVYNGHTLDSTEVTNNYNVEKSNFGL
jgi:hypothetical protein